MTDWRRALENLRIAVHGDGVALHPRLITPRRPVPAYAMVLAGLLTFSGAMAVEHAAAGSQPEASSQTPRSVRSASGGSSPKVQNVEALLPRDGWIQSCALSACVGHLSTRAAAFKLFRATCTDEHGGRNTFALDRRYFQSDSCLQGLWSFNGYHPGARATCSWEGSDGSTWTALAHVDFAAHPGEAGWDVVMTYSAGDVPIGVHLTLANKYAPPESSAPVTMDVSSQSGDVYHYQTSLDPSVGAEAEFPRDFGAPGQPGRYTWTAKVQGVVVVERSFQLTGPGSHDVGAQCFDATAWFPSNETSRRKGNGKDLHSTPTKVEPPSRAELEAQLFAKIGEHFREEDEQDAFERRLMTQTLAGAYSNEEYSKLVVDRWKNHVHPRLWLEEIPALTQTYRETFGIEALRAFCTRSRPLLLRRFKAETVKWLPMKLSTRNDLNWQAQEGQRVGAGGAERIGCESID